MDVFCRGGQIILCWMKDKLVDFFPRVQFWFGNYVCIMFSALTNGVVQVSRSRLRFGLISFKFKWKIADSWPYLIYTLYSFFISKGKERKDLSPFYGGHVTKYNAYDARILTSSAVFLSCPDMAARSSTPAWQLWEKGVFFSFLFLSTF